MPSALRSTSPAIDARPPALDLVLLVVGVLGVSMSGPLIAATAAPALAIAFWRTAMASGVLVPWAATRRRDELRTLSRRAWGLSILAGAFLAAHFALWVPSLSLTSVASSTALVSLLPVWSALLARAMGEHVPRGVWWGIAIAVVGVVVLVGTDVDLSARALLGDAMALAGGAMAAAYMTVGSRVRTELSTAGYTAICYSTCAVLLGTTCVLGRVSLSGYGAESWFKIVALTVCAQLLGHSMFNVVLRSMSATTVSLAILFENPGATLIAAVWLQEVPSAAAIVGIVILLAGTAVVIVSSVRTTRLATDPAIG